MGDSFPSFAECINCGSAELEAVGRVDIFVIDPFYRQFVARSAPTTAVLN